ncbi:unnamed protein product [Peronospora destructor]|uniref:Uncharacterized protein n=1 Tax=Peronospora destructor TaxID=86335 RepID=A0AAV0TTD7_9STRA|nr:unnamed protein product [Peronospora destructor]
MNVVVPTGHHEKSIYYDNLALPGLQDCFPTRKLQRLMEKPPQTAEELQKVYAAEVQHRQRPTSEVEDADMSDE